MSDAATKEPMPTTNAHPDIQTLVMNDLRLRMQYGKAKYGQLLQPFNGRSALWDAYQEALDLVVYLRQEIYEQEYKAAFVYGS